MTHYSTLNVQLSNSQLNKLKSRIKNATEVTLKLSSNVVGDSNDETNFPHKLLLANTKTAKRRKAFSNHSSVNIKLLKTQLCKIVQSGGFLYRLLGPLQKTDLPLMKNVLKPVVKSAIMPLVSTASSVRNATIQKKFFESARYINNFK